MQLCHPDLPAEFPPLRSLDSFAHNLPVQLTSFIGREAEMSEVEGIPVLQVAETPFYGVDGVLKHLFDAGFALVALLALLPVMLLTLHPAFGSSLYGDERWIDLGPITLQPADFSSVAGAPFTVVFAPSSDMRNAGGIPPLIEIHAAGINVALGTDNVTNNNSYDMFKEMTLTGKLMSLIRGDPAAIPRP